MKEKRVKFTKAWSKVLLSVVLLVALFLPMTLAGATYTFNNNISPHDGVADPTVLYKDGFYYYVRGIGEQLDVYKSPSLANIFKGTPVTVFRDSVNCAPGSAWAPELQWLNNKWYIYYANNCTNNGGSGEGQRMYVLEGTSTDAQGSYINRGKIFEGNNKWSIDETVLKMGNGDLYLVWSGFQDNTSPQKLWIAPLSKTEPWKLLANRSFLAEPNYAWEGNVNEGPEVIRKNGKIHIVYSANSAGHNDYALGLLTFTGTNPLNSTHWTKKSEPIFKGANGVVSPGHNFFVKSANGGEDWNVYHGMDNRDASYGGRWGRAQPFFWNGDNTPNLGLPVSNETEMSAPDGDARRYEAESATINNASRINEGSASNGKKVGFIDFSDSYVQFNVNVPEAGSYKMYVRYGNGTGESATHNVSINGGSNGTVSYGSYGWNNWKWVTKNVSLNAGNNTIRLSKGTGKTELDAIEVQKNTKYEAENATLTNAQIMDELGASNYKKVGMINFADSAVQFNVNVPTAGTYTMTVRYTNGMNAVSTHDVSVNGGASSSITYDYHGGWDTYEWVTKDVQLNAGNNTIKFTRGTNFAELDSIDIFKNKFYEAELATLNNASILNETSASKGKKVGMINGSDSYVQFNVNVPTAGVYNMVVRYGNGSGADSTHNVSVNGGASKIIPYGNYGWNTWQWANMDVTLNAGNNTIKFAKGINYAELDTIELFPHTNVRDRGFENQVTDSISAPWFGDGTGNKGIDRALGYAHSGRNNAWIRATSGWNAIYQTVAVTPYTSYRLTGWTRNSNNFTEGWFGIRTADNSGIIAQTKYGGLVPYTKLTVDFDSGPNTSVRVFIGYEAPGSDSFMQADDISLQTR